MEKETSELVRVGKSSKNELRHTLRPFVKMKNIAKLMRKNPAMLPVAPNGIAFIPKIFVLPDVKSCNAILK